MKKFLICPICLMATGAIAQTTFYYDTSGVCSSGLFLDPNATSCSQAITKITPPAASGKNFSGYYANGTQVIDKSGNILINSTTAATLFNNADPSAASRRRAEAGYTASNKITVQPRQNWDGQQSGWYTCGVWGFHMCEEDQDYYAPPAVNCWSYSFWPCDSNGQNCKYDYAFNSYRMADGKTFVKPSCLRSGGCSNANGCWCNPYPNDIATGSKIVGKGCSVNYLGPLTNDVNSLNNVSLWKIWPFACKRIKNGADWVDDYTVSHGRVHVNVDLADRCKYELVCDTGYVPEVSETEVNSVECIGLECKGWFDGFMSVLTDFKHLNTSCVENTGAQTETGSGTVGTN